MTAAEFATRIKGARRRGNGPWWDGRCPAHEDARASLSWCDGDRALIVRCHAGCALDAIAHGAQVSVAELFRDVTDNGREPTAPSRIVATYDYVDLAGVVRYQVVRFEPKDFRQRRPDGAGGFIWNMHGVAPLVYRLGELAEAPRAFVVEGEQDADALAALGLVATTNHGGAGKWRAEHTQALVAAAVPEVIVLGDNDRPGEAHAEQVARTCAAAGLRTKRVRLPGLPPLHDKHGEDVSDWLAMGHTVNELEALADAAVPLAPSSDAADELDDVPVPEPAAPYVLSTPPASFVTQYVMVAQQRTDAPAEAHELAAVLVLSALAGPRARLPLAYRADGVRLVLWGMNVVDSTSGRKTTVNEFACDVLRQALGDDAILPWKGSPEAFIQAFARRDGQAAVFARDEYTGLLAAMKRGGYVAGLAQDFIRAYDGLPIIMARTAKMNRTTGQRVDDTDRVRDPYLVKLCAATRTSFVSTATIDDVLDGLLARFVFTSGTAEERPPQRSTPALEAAWLGVVQRAQAFRGRAEELLRVDIPDRVLADHWDLEKRYKALALQAPRPEAAGPTMKRLAETVLKVAALFAIDRGGVEIVSDDLVAAAAMGERWKRTTMALIADIGRTKFQARCDTVLGTILKHPKGIAQAQLYRAHRDLDKREFESVTDALEMQRLAHGVEMKTEGRRGVVPVVWFPGAMRERSDA